MTQFIERAAHQLVGVDHPLVQPLPAETRKRQQVIDQFPHPLRAAADGLKVALALRRHLRAKILQHRLGKSVHRPQRGAQIMRHRIRKRLQLLVGRLELGRALDHPVLELNI